MEGPRRLDSSQESEEAKPTRDEVDALAARKAGHARQSAASRDAFVFAHADAGPFGAKKEKETTAALAPNVMRISRAGLVAQCWSGVATSVNAWWFEYVRKVAAVGAAMGDAAAWGVDAAFRSQLEKRCLQGQKPDFWKELNRTDGLRLQQPQQGFQQQQQQQQHHHQK